MQPGYNDGQTGGAGAGANGNGYNENNEPDPNDVDRWPGCRPQLMLARLKSLLPTELGLITKPLAAAYKDWGKMNAHQRKTTIEFWDKMPQDKKTLFLTVVGHDTTQSANTVIATAAATTQEPPTTKDD
ncbi:hypothetical protein B484DRAFT_409744, partial [Ochromonadaceae sp. CCMP2298]